jgi:hypothetical protein
LVSSQDVPGLSEKTILPETTVVANEKFIRFPIDRPACRPIDFALIEQRLPRFSLFYGNGVTVNGAALLACGGRHFTDASLVALDVEAHAAEYQKLLERFGFGGISIPFLLGEEKACELVSSASPTLVLCAEEPSNFGSWIFRIVPKLLLSMEHEKFSSVFIYQDQSWMENLIRFSGYEGDIIHHDPWYQHQIDNAIIPSLPVPDVLFRSEILNLFDELHDRQDPSVDLGEKLYVSRRGHALRNPRYRALENETGLVAALEEELGFVEFIPEEYSIAQQVAIFDRARLMVGPGGSNMIGCVMARHAELIVNIEPCDEWVWGHMNLMSSTPASWSMVEGRLVSRGQPPHRNWVVNIEAVIRGIRALIG